MPARWAGGRARAAAVTSGWPRSLTRCRSASIESISRSPTSRRRRRLPRRKEAAAVAAVLALNSSRCAAESTAIAITSSTRRRARHIRNTSSPNRARTIRWIATSRRISREIRRRRISSSKGRTQNLYSRRQCHGNVVSHFFAYS